MSAVISASLSARPLYTGANEGIFLMGPGVYIHDMTPAMAQQWIETLTPIAKDDE